jgi:NADH-ubiquinone oxidoreductase chain 5
MLAAMTRSAQIPFSAWLPAAMAAPTPVSALVHSSTLVTAGVYLIIRFSSLIISRDMFCLFLMLISTLTMFIAGVCANLETDLKRVIALSTLSQLGLMMIILSMGFVNLAYFHLLTHALFRALLFMCAGAVIHSRGESQDVRFIGGLVISMPIISVCINIANLALCGFPFLAGFYSKDRLIEASFRGGYNFFIVILLILSVGLTSIYSFRLSFYSIWALPRVGISSLSDGGVFMNLSIILLTIFAVLGGRLIS